MAEHLALAAPGSTSVVMGVCSSEGNAPHSNVSPSLVVEFAIYAGE